MRSRSSNSRFFSCLCDPVKIESWSLMGKRLHPPLYVAIQFLQIYLFISFFLLKNRCGAIPRISKMACSLLPNPPSVVPWDIEHRRNWGSLYLGPQYHAGSPKSLLHRTTLSWIWTTSRESHAFQCPRLIWNINFGVSGVWASFNYS